MKNSLPSKAMRLDETARSANSSLPAFLDAPAYYGFPLIEETRIDGWCYGAVTDFEQPDAPDGCHFGDGFVEAPDGSRAGLVWQTDVDSIEEILPPDAKRWGVWGIGFPRPVQTVADLVYNFRQVLPDLQEKHRQFKSLVK